MLRIEPYKLHSRGAKALSLSTGILRATHRQVERHGSFTTILNWGSSERRFDCEYINNPEAVTIASDKLQSARQFERHGVPAAPFTTSRTTAEGWRTSNTPFLARCLTRGSGGRGITYYGDVGTGECDGSTPDPSELGCNDDRDGTTERAERAGRVIRAPLYVQYIKKAVEYRVHVFDGRVIDVQEKRKRREVENDEVDYRVRNSENGWVYCRDNVHSPSAVREAAIMAVDALCLDFGAADVGWNEHSQTACVYEVNTAPGLEGTTLDYYYRALLLRLPQLSGGAYKRRRARGFHPAYEITAHGAQMVGNIYTLAGEQHDATS